MEMNLEQRQAKFVEMFSRKAAAVAWSSEQLANLVVEATSHNGLIAFSELLAFPAFYKLAGTAESGSLDLLRLFAFGTWEDYKSNSAILPALNLKQARKLKQLTIINMVSNKECKIVTYEQLLKKLEFTDVKELEVFLDLCASSGNIKFRLNKRRRNLQMQDDAEDLLPKIRGKLLCGQSFDLVLQEAATIHIDSQTGLRSNAVVKQVRVPLGGTGFLLKAEIQTLFTFLFGMLIQHVTSAHVANKSYGGKIYAGMFFVLGNQLFLRLEAAPTKRLTDENSKLDYGAVSAILKKHTRLKVSPDGAEEEFVYPIYALDLFDHLDCKANVLSVDDQKSPMLKAQNGNYITFLRCHQTLQSTSARAASVFYIRKQHKASTGWVKYLFEMACLFIKLKINVADIHDNWLFLGVIAYARHKGIPYGLDAMGCFFLLRDWETHAPEHLSESQKLIFTAAVRNYLVEHFFLDFLPKFMYRVLSSGIFDLKVWLRKLLQVSETCTAFTMTEWNLTGLYVPLLPKNILLEQHINQFLHDMERVRENIRDDPSYNYMLAKWRALNKLREKNVTVYYKVLLDNIQEYAPIVYMPTVRTVCQNSGCMFQRGWVMCITIQDMGMILSMMQNWLADQVDIVIVTDGSSVSGTDDLGVRAAGVAVGKLDMYVAVAGINPKRVLPVIIDIGTNCQELHDDPLYYGLQENRLNGEKYLALMDEFMDAIFSRWPSAVVEFEEFESDLALILLERYRKKHRIFNGNIEGTAAVIIAGLLGAARAQGIDMPVFPKQKIIVAVAGSVGPELEVVNATTRTIGRILKTSGTVFGSPRSGFWIVDSHGLITDVDPDARPFARCKSELSHQVLGEGASLTEVVKKVKPDVIVGFSAVGGLFSKEVLEALKDSSSSRPAVFAMSNPTKNAECTPEEAFSVIGEKTIFASGGRFPDVDLGNGKIGHSNQGNSMYLFPGIGLGTLLSGARVISDGMLKAAAECLASYMKEEEVLQGIIYPSISRIRDITAKVAAAVVRKAVAEDLADGYRGMDESELAGLNEEKTIEYVKQNMWSPVYPT